MESIDLSKNLIEFILENDLVSMNTLKLAKTNLKILNVTIENLIEIDLSFNFLLYLRKKISI